MHAHNTMTLRAYTLQRQDIDHNREVQLLTFLEKYYAFATDRGGIGMLNSTSEMLTYIENVVAEPP